MDPASTLILSCHCRTHVWSFPHDPASPPQKHTFCHCSACRQRTGSLAAVCYTCPSDVRPPADMVAKLGGYKSVGDKGNGMTHYFCKTCGTNLFASTGVTKEEVAKGGGGGWASAEWVLSTSALDRSEGLYDLIGHEYLSSTLDGGLANWLLELNRNPMDLWLESSDEPKTKTEDLPSLTVNEKQASAQVPSLHYKCLCKSTSIYVARPVQPATRNLPYWLVAPLPISDPSTPDAVGPIRRRAKLCACADCTRSSGVAYPAAAWVDVPFADMYTDEKLTQKWVNFKATVEGKAGGRDDDVRLDLPGTTRYDSTPGKTSRFFCYTCGAKILLLSHLNSSVPRLSASLLVPKTTSLDGTIIKHGTLAPVHIAWWAGANVCQSVADMGLEDSVDPELGTRMAVGLTEWTKDVQGGEMGLTARQEKETARKEAARRELVALGDD